MTETFINRYETPLGSLYKLQERGMNGEFASLLYRLDIAKAMANHYQARRVLLFDDLAYAVPKQQRKLLHGLPGYERALLPGLLLAPGFEDGATILVGAPPNPVEISYIKSLKTKLEEAIGKQVEYRILYENNEELINLLDLPEDVYSSLCFNYAANIGVTIPLPTESYHLDLCERHAEKIFGEEPTLVIPFQTTDTHRDRLFALQGYKIHIPDIPNLDKAYNNMLLRKHGFSNIPQMTAVTSEGRIVESFDDLEIETVNSKVPLTPQTAETFARGIITAVERLHQQGKDSYIKIDSSGVSGLGNLDPSKHPRLYDKNTSFEEKVKCLTEFLLKTLSDNLPNMAVVEEYVKMAEIEGVSQDYTVCGQLVNGVFLPTSINPFGTTNGVYDCEWVAPNAYELSEDPNLWSELFRVFARMGEIIAKHASYKNGILAGDVFVTQDNRILVHDYNFRRGGRSTPEALMALIPKGWFEAQVEIGLQGKFPNEELFTLYTAVCEELFSDYDFYPFSTAFGYFGKNPDDHGNNFMKFKLMVPADYLRHLPRSKHLIHITEIVYEIVKKLVKNK